MLKDIDILVLGSLNMDLVIESERNPYPGETIRGKNFSTFPGGKGNNQAVAIGRLEGDVAFAGCLGADSYGSQLIENLKANNVKDYGIYISDKSSTGLAVINVFNGQNTIVLFGGANDSCLKENIKNVEVLINRSKILLMQLEIPMDTIEWAAQIAIQNNTRVILNPAPAAFLSDKLYKNIDTLLPNEIEAKLLLGYNADEEVDYGFLTEMFIKKGVKNVIITLGKDGVIFNNGSEIKKVGAYSVKAIDTTGAGDSFIGGFCYLLSKGKSMMESITFATAVAAIKVTRMGAQSGLPTLDEVNNFLTNL